MALTKNDFVLNGHTLNEWEALEDLLDSDARSAVFYEAIKNSSNNALRGLLGRAALMPLEVRLERNSKNYQRGFQEFISKISANPVYLSIAQDGNFQTACKEFRRLKKSGKTNYADPFAELRFLQCFVTTLGIHYLIKTSNQVPKVASVKTRQSARATSKKLLALFNQGGLKLRKYSDEGALKRSLTLLIAEIDANVKLPRQDLWTTERCSVKRFADSYYSNFGHVSPSVTLKFAAMIAYEVSHETLKGQLKAIKDFDIFKPETIFYEGGIVNVDKLPFSTVGILPTK